ncbi:MAG: zinc-binding alcohol dehydrogenase, partial [Myxococcota bacterium]
QPNQGDVRVEALPPLQPGWCRIEALASSISPGTERLVGAGRVPQPLWEAMRCPYMEGSFALPLKYGYSLVGRVVEGAPDWKGQRVHLLHPHQSAAVVRTTDLVPVPDAVDTSRATLASNMETAINAVWDSRVALGDRVVVVGFGIVGALVALVMRGLQGTEVMVVEVEPEQRALAASLGLTAVKPEAVIPGEADIAIHASATAAGLQTALDAVGLEGRVVELSWYGDGTTTLALGGAFHSQRKQIISSQVSHIPSHRRARWDHQRRKRLVFRLLADSAWDACVTSTSPLEGVPDWFASAQRGLAHRIDYA